MQKQFRMGLILANLFTLARIFLAPVIIVLILGKCLINMVIAFAVFIFGALSDALDGIFARKYRAESKFGFIVDPIADKILVIGTLFAISMIDYLMVPLWCLAIILVRDIAVSVLKPISEKCGFSIPTTFFAKTKTATQFVGIIAVFIYLIFVNLILPSPSLDHIFSVLGPWTYTPHYIVLTLTAITVISGIEYLFLFTKGILGKH